MIREVARDFAMREVLPAANRLDPVKGDIPAPLVEKIAELGYFGIMIPEEYGGLGLGSYEYCLISEELSRAWMSVGSLLARGSGMIGWRFMSEPQKRRYLPAIASGKFLGAGAISEPQAGSDVANISCRAHREGDSWVITGSKYWCTFADGADYIVTFARTAEPAQASQRHDGITALLVEKPRGALPEGVSGNPIPKIGYFGWKTWELSFDGCRVPAENMLGEEGKAFYMAAAGLEVARAHTASRAIGLARAALEDGMAYAAERLQFGQPIAEFQNTRFVIADMATEIEAARQLLYHVCTTIDAGGRCDLEASMVKLFASEMAERVTSKGLQIHGGAGYTTLHAVERHWRDARLTTIFEGTSEIQRRIISDRLLGKPRGILNG